ncbi:MAG: TlpA family protein disulfide reductase [Bacteroidales bacterium]|nr:TlpA family protein disulfide reductase [Bacteroidales bacterium]
MKRTVLTIVISLFFFSFSFGQSDTIKTLKKIPSVEIKDLEGNVFNTADIQNDGSPIILDFWSTTCKPCIKELMALDENYADWQEETGVKIFIVATDGARSMNNVAPFVNGKGWAFVTLLDPNSDFKRAMGVIDIPHTFVIDGDGNIVHEHTAYTEGDEEQYYEILLELTENKE